MTPIERIDHIEQCLVRMRPTMGYELDGAAEIRKELATLREIFGRLDRMIEGAAGIGQRATEAMTLDALSGDTCG
jgi:hypothetical protein